MKNGDGSALGYKLVNGCNKERGHNVKFQYECFPSGFRPVKKNCAELFLELRLQKSSQKVAKMATITYLVNTALRCTPHHGPGPYSEKHPKRFVLDVLQ
jgi:hypothetical protein